MTFSPTRLGDMMCWALCSWKLERCIAPPGRLKCEVLKRLILEQQPATELRQLEIERLKLILAQLRRRFGRGPEVLDQQIEQPEAHAEGAGSCPSSQHALFFGQTNSEKL